jgi:Family of unknown function (DUF5706)
MLWPGTEEQRMGQARPTIILKNLSAQIEFAKHNYEDQQNIIRHLDVKAGVFITALAFFVMNAPVAGRDVIGKLRWSGPGSVSSTVYVVSGLALVCSFLAAALCIQRVIRVRGFKTSSDSPGLLFANDILKFENADQFNAATEMATEEDLLRTYTTQIYTLCMIVRQKAKALGTARWPTGVCFVAWVVNVGTALYIASWK